MKGKDFFSSPVFFLISGIRVGNAKGFWLKYLNWRLRLASRLRARRRGLGPVDTETHSHAPAHAPFRVNCLRDLRALPPQKPVLPSGAESKSLFGGHFPASGPVTYGPREGRAGGRQADAEAPPAYARQRLAEPGRAAGDRLPAPATRVQFARTCLRLRGSSKRCPV